MCKLTLILLIFSLISLETKANCDDVSLYASNAVYSARQAYSHAQNAYDADTLDEAHDYAEMAMHAAMEAESEAGNTESACED